jgi:hypothetical protein
MLDSGEKNHLESTATYSQTCVQRPHSGPKFVAVVGRRSLFRGSFMSGKKEIETPKC